MNIQNSAVNQAGGNSVTNAAGGTITPVGAALPTASGITINNSSLAGSILNAGTITASTAGPGNGIIVTNNATVTTGITNTGSISAPKSDGIIVGGNATGAVTTVSILTFGGGITNAGKIGNRQRHRRRRQRIG